MSGVLNWARFFAEVLPELSALARSLFVVHGGNAEAARQELRVIRDHGERRRENQRQLDEALAKARAERGET